MGCCVVGCVFLDSSKDDNGSTVNCLTVKGGSAMILPAKDTAVQPTRNAPSAMSLQFLKSHSIWMFSFRYSNT